MKRGFRVPTGVHASLLTAALLAAAATGCEPTTSNPGCPYTEFPGIAVIRTVTPDDSPSRLCENDVVIVFDFVPDDSSAVDRYRFPSWPDTGLVFDLIPGGSAPDGWAEKEGMTPGSELPCVRREIRAGPCQPLIFDFPEVDLSDWTDYCDRMPVD